ncbi:MAG: hypothetical protein K2M87_07135 [Muribaculaceae bacterium]|nr:hypothetical protein [Muribaculaceae bacterium]
MKHLLSYSLLLSIILLSCRGKSESDSQFPENFNKIGDAGRIDWLKSRIPADSLARFIIYGALDINKSARIDTLATATNHAYEVLHGEELDLFCTEYDALAERLPLADKVRLYLLAGSEDPQRLGYRLGLEYMGNIRDDNKNAAQVEKELREFKKACGTDTAMYRRFITGFHTVLNIDHGTDVPEEIYRKFANYE